MGLTSVLRQRSAPDPDLVDVERVPWSVLGPQMIRSWGYPRGTFQPEHLEILGQTGSGKSFLEVCILLQRAHARGSHIVVICTKPADETMLKTGFPITDQYPPQDPRDVQIIFWPQAHGLGKAGQVEQAHKIRELMDKLWRADSNVIVVFDEIAYIHDDLHKAAPDAGLKSAVSKYFREGRGLGITVVATTQRPQGVPRQMHSEAGWSICFAPKDEEDAKRMAQVLGSQRIYMPILMELNREKYEFLIVHGIDNQKYISWVDHALPHPVNNHR